MWKYHRQNFIYFFVKFSTPFCRLRRFGVWLALHVEQDDNFGFALEFFTSRCMKDQSFPLLSPLTSAWRWVEMCVGLFFLWRNWYRRRGEQGGLSLLGQRPQSLVGKESKEHGENGEARNSKWSTSLVCTVDYILWWSSQGINRQLCPVIKERHVCN